MTGSVSKTREAKVAGLTTAPWNPRRITERQMERLKKSLEADRAMLQARPLIALPDGTVIAGNHRLLAAQALGWTTIPVITVDLDDTTAKQWAIKDNNNYAEWQENELASLVYEMQAQGADIDLTGLPEDDIRKMMEELSFQQKPKEGEDEAPALPEKPKTRPGDLYVLGPHRLLCGDATKAADYARVMAGEFAELMLTDPPYNVDYEGKTADALKIENDAMSDKQFRAFLKAALSEAARNLIKGGPTYIFGPAGPISEDFMWAMAEAKLEHHQTLIWAKHSMVMGRSDYHYKHEPILYGWRPGAAHRWHGGFDKTSVLDDDFIDYGKLDKKALVELIKEMRANDGSDVLRFDRPSASRDHPTQKPVKLLAHLIRNSTKGGELVLDPFAGSGSTMIAAEQLGRAARLLELDPRYCDVVVKRWEEYTGGKATKEKR